MTNEMLSGKKLIQILLVEDQIDDAELTMEAIEEGRLRTNIHWVQDGEAAMAFLHRVGAYVNAPRPDLILLDLNLPKKNGLEVLNDVKQSSALKRIPIVMMTSSDDEEDVAQAYNRYANCFVTKPVDVDKFLEAIRQIEDFWFTLATIPAA